MESVSQLRVDLNCKIQFESKDESIFKYKQLVVVNGYDKFIIRIVKHSDGIENFYLQYYVTNETIEDKLSDISDEVKLYFATPINVLLSELDKMRDCALNYGTGNTIYRLRFDSDWIKGLSVQLGIGASDNKELVKTNTTLEIFKCSWIFRYSNFIREFESEEEEDDDSNLISDENQYRIFAHLEILKGIFILNEVKRRLSI